MPGIRVALLTEIPAPFRIPLFNALAERDDVRLRVLFLSDRDPKRPYPVYRDEFRFDARTLPGHDVARGSRWVVLNGGVLGELRRSRPQVIVIGGWNQPAFWQAAAWARIRRIPLVTWVESTERDARPGNVGLERAKRWIVDGSAALLVPGSASAEYARSLGVPAERVVVAPNAVDQSIFRDGVAQARGSRERLREEIGLTRPTFLFVGRFDPEKGLADLLEAADGLDADVVVIGSGPGEAALRAAALPNVRIVGRVERDELVPWYAAVDAFVLPSRSDQWGMVLNEAASAALPIVTSDAPGAAYDLVDDGVSGIRYPAGDVTALRAALARVAEDGGWRRSAGERSLELAARHTPELWAEAVARLVTCLERREPLLASSG